MTDCQRSTPNLCKNPAATSRNNLTENQGACSSAPRTYTNRIKTGCDIRRLRCRSFGFQKRCCRPTDAADPVIVPLPIPCHDLYVALTVPFLTDALVSKEIDPKAVDLGSVIRSPIYDGIDYDKSVVGTDSDSIEITDIDFNLLDQMEPITLQTGAVIVTLKITKSVDGSYFVRTSSRSDYLASEMTPANLVLVTVKSSISCPFTDQEDFTTPP